MFDDKIEDRNSELVRGPYNHVQGHLHRALLKVPLRHTHIRTAGTMSLAGLMSGAECAVEVNPLSQVLKHTDGDRSLQQVSLSKLPPCRHIELTTAFLGHDCWPIFIKSERLVSLFKSRRT